ncbi:hypothetical protein RRG08_013964 [Elysia crispata]|uniref:Oxidoreductase n=1 Tax=Elysia crispata TaxID=231223 RepID=A0AAE0YUG2_9GAST|nr:hypothetical protein RRG08_013964 [Elysia crispata]
MSGEQRNNKNGSAQTKEGDGPLTCLIVGAGRRGKYYSKYALLYPDQMKVVGVADLDKKTQCLYKYNIQVVGVADLDKETQCLYNYTIQVVGVADLDKETQCLYNYTIQVVGVADLDKETQCLYNYTIQVVGVADLDKETQCLYNYTIQVVGVADLVQTRREYLAQTLGTLETENLLTDWQQAAERSKFADFVIISTTDRLHKEPAVAFARLGYDILLEKPMGVTQEDCREIVEVCRACNVILTVCHVLRFSPWATLIKDIIDSGRLGEVVNIRLTDPVGFWHFAHAYVRGDWRNEESSTFALMSKSVHDVDLITYWMDDRKCVSLSSFGKLSHFNKDSKPAQATAKCQDCPTEEQCPYSAKKIYIDAFKAGHNGWPVDVLTDIVDLENITEALRTGPYGKCVYDSDNDVVSNQVVNFQFDDGAAANFSMVAFTKLVGQREIKIYGTLGELVYEDGWDEMLLFDFLSRTTEQISVSQNFPNEMAGHTGAGYHLMKTFLQKLKSESRDNAAELEETLTSHMLVFAADKARLENKVVNITPGGPFS